jgi:transposase
MMIIGCDFHPSWQQINWLDMETGETGERKLVHASGDAKRFYEQLTAPVLIGMEATGNSQWFIEMVEDLGALVKKVVFNEIFMRRPRSGIGT